MPKEQNYQCLKKIDELSSCREQKVEVNDRVMGRIGLFPWPPLPNQSQRSLGVLSGGSTCSIRILFTFRLSCWEGDRGGHEGTARRGRIQRLLSIVVPWSLSMFCGHQGKIVATKMPPAGLTFERRFIVWELICGRGRQVGNLLGSVVRQPGDKG